VYTETDRYIFEQEISNIDELDAIFMIDFETDFPVAITSGGKVNVLDN
jgi:hypothetical protein